MRSLLAVVLFSALALAACGGGDDDSRKGAGIDAGAVIAALKTMGLPIGESLAYTAETDPNKMLGRPNGYTSKATFHDSRLKQRGPMDLDGGGSVEVFASADEAESRKKYIDGIGKAGAVLSEYSWLKGAVLLRVSRELTPDQANAYRDALAKIPAQ